MGVPVALARLLKLLAQCRVLMPNHALQPAHDGAAEFFIWILSMSYMTVKELDLLVFFGIEPEVTDSDIPWPYNKFVYSVTCGATSVSFSIEPAYKELKIILKNGGVKFYELHAVSLEDVRYHNDNGRETLEIILDDGDRFWFGLYPQVVINHEFTSNS